LLLVLPIFSHNYDYPTWEPQTDTHYRELAELYKIAVATKDSTELKKHVKMTGIWYTELLRLLYYKPSTFVVIDVMHNLFLGLIKEHFEKILGHDPEKEERERMERMKEEKNKNRNMWKEGDKMNENKNENEVEVNEKVEAKTVLKLSSLLCSLCIHIPFLDNNPEPDSLASQNAIQSLLSWLSQPIIFDEKGHVFDATYKK
ncbi:hypothetical protein H0H87_005991, partial [Tephrocybe sp. NHM501043]